jgi:hypothetical protein
LVDELKDRVNVRGKFAAPQDFHWRGNGQALVRQRQTDGFFANIEPEEALATGNSVFYMVKLADRHAE